MSGLLTVCGVVESTPSSEDCWHGHNRLRVLETNEVVWTRGTSTVFRRFEPTVSGTRPLKICFATFSGVLCACILTNDIVLVNGENGSAWDISLPFTGNRIWPNPLGGFFIERWMSRKKHSERQDPILFTCAHPLEEVKPVELVPSESIVAILDHLPYVLTYSDVSLKHALWKIKNIEHPERSDASTIDAEISFEPIWSIPRSAWSGQARRVFTLQITPDQTVMCVHIPAASTVFGISLSASAANEFTISNCLDAIPIQFGTKQSSNLIVILTTDNIIELFRCGTRLCAIPSPSSMVVRAFDESRSSDGSFGVLLMDNTKVRVSIGDGIVTGSSVIGSIVRAAGRVDKTLESFLTLTFIDLLPLSTDLTLNISLLFREMILFVGRTTRGDGRDDRDGEEVSDFEKLLRSDTHRRRNKWNIFDLDISAVKRTTDTDRSWPVEFLRKSSLVPLLAKFSKASFHNLMHKFAVELHLEYEELKLDVLQHDHATSIASVILVLLESIADRSSPLYVSFWDHYYRDFGSRIERLSFPGTPNKDHADDFRNVSAPANVMVDLFNSLTCNPSDLESSSSHWTGKRSRCLLKVFSSIGKEQDFDALRALVEARFTPMDVGSLPMGVQIVVRELLHRCREKPPSHLDALAYALIGREDVRISKLHEDTSPLTHNPGSMATVSTSASLANRDSGDLAFLQQLTSLRFSRDRRVREVYRLLDYGCPVLLVVKRKPEMTDHDLIAAQQTKLKKLVTKSFGGTLGRGALMLFTKTKFHEKSIQVGELNKAGRLPPQQVLVQLDEKHVVSTKWPAFHAGVAAGLAIAPRLASMSQAERDLLRSWLLFNKPKPLTDEHAGVVLAMGLNKDLACLTIPDTYEFLGPRHDLTSVGTLLGLGCARAGTSDANVRRTLTLHVPSLFPQEILDADLIASLVPAAALVALGMLHRGTCNRLMCEFMLDEMTKSPLNNAAVDERENYIMCAGLALGLIALGAGKLEGGLAGLADLELEDRLQSMIVGGPVNKLDGSASSLDEAERYGVKGSGRMGNESSRSRRWHRADDATGIGGEAGRGGDTAEGEARCSRVLEGTDVNTDISAPAASLTLGLIFLDANDETMKSHLAAPQTRFLLELVRPDLLMFRYWAMQLIMWGSVQATTTYIEQHIPGYLATISTRSSSGSQDIQDFKFLSKCRAFIIAGICLGIGCRYAGTASKLARETLIYMFSAGSTSSGSGSFSNVLDGVDVDCADRYYSCIAVALGLVMAGTGDLKTLRVLRSFRRKSKRYGAHQLASLSLGFLFLGSGKMSFARTKEAIAGIVCSVVPILASGPDDNSSYLQALRHMYVLGVENRLVETVDVDSKQPCLTPLVLSLDPQAMELDPKSVYCVPDLNDLDVAESSRGEETMDLNPPKRALNVHVVAPCWLPPLDTIRSISVVGSRYWELTVFQPQSFPVTIPVKLRPEQLSYQVDPQGLSSLTARPRPRDAREMVVSLREFASKSPFTLSFVSHVSSHFYLVYECLIRDCLDALSCLLDLARTTSLERSRLSPFDAEQICFLKRYLTETPLGRTKQYLGWDQILRSKLGAPHIDARLLMSYVKGDMRWGETEASEAEASQLNLAGVPRMAEAIRMGMSNPANLSHLINGVSADALLEIMEALDDML